MAVATVWGGAVLCIPTGVLAQNLLRPMDPAVPAVAGRGSGAYLNDSFEVAETLVRVRKHVEKKQWREAAELVQSLSDNFPDKLVRLDDQRYVGVRERVNLWVAEWPSEGLEAYRSRTEAKVRERVDALRDSRQVDEYVQLFDRYFCTAAAGRLADTIGQLAIESGNLTLARSVYQRTLDRHPDRGILAKSNAAMLGILDAIENPSGASATPPVGTERIRWLGQDRTVQEVVAEIPHTFVTPRETEPGDWSTMGGDLTRNRPTETQVDELGLLWSVSLSTGAGVETQPLSQEEGGTPGKSGGRSVTAFPVVFGSLVFTQRGPEVSAFHRNTGGVAWRFRVSDAPPTPGRESEDSQSGWEGLTVHEGRVYALFSVDGGASHGESSRASVELVCLDALTGRVIWRTTESLRGDRSIEVCADASPMVHGNRVFVVARRRRSFGFEDCHLHGFDAAAGTLLFRTHLGCASTGMLGSRIGTMSIPAAQADTIYVCTNLGTIAAVTASTGSVRWLRIYERDGTGAGPGGGWAARERMPWEVNPVLVSDGRLICHPSDSQFVFVLSAPSGDLLRTVPVAEFGPAPMILGVRGELLCAAGTHVGCADLSNAQMRFRAELPAEMPLHGRGAWVGRHLWIPTRGQLLRYYVEDGSRTESSWGQSLEGGNLLVTDHQVLVAGGKDISAHVRKSEIWNSLRGRMTSAPGDPVPALELAEVALRTGDLREAVDALDESVRRAGGLSEPVEAALARRMFDAVLTFVEVLSARSRLDAETLDKLFQYGSNLAPDPSAHVSFRLRFGWLFESRGQAQRGLALYQQILRDRSLRDMVVPSGNSIPQTGGQVARARISALIDREDPSVYAAFEAEAKRWLEAAKSAQDADALFKIAEVFPNSTAAPAALIGLADLAARSERHDEAARGYARAYHQYPRLPETPQLMRKIADAFEKAGRREHAYRWLTKASREFPAVTWELDGKSWSFLEYRERLADVRARLEPTRPRIHLPLDEGFVRTFDLSVSLLVPRFGEDPASRWERAFVYTPGSLRALRVHDGTDLWSVPVDMPVKPDLLVATSELAVFATLHGVIALDSSTGERRWLLGRLRPPRDDPNEDWENGEIYRAVTLIQDRIVAVRDDGQMTCVDLTSGKPLWSKTHRPVTAGILRGADRWIAYPVVQDEQIVVCLLDASTGEWHDAILTGEEQAVEDVFITLDSQLLLVTLRTVLLYDLETRTLRWRLNAEGRIRRDSLQVDMDGLYFSDDAATVQKVGLEDGTLLWRSDRFVAGREEDFSVDRQGHGLIVTTSSSAAAIDSASGQTLWKATSPKDARFVRRMISGAFLVAIHVPQPHNETENRAFFYDHRNGSGVLPRDGVLALGDLADLRAVLIVDDALLIQTGAAIEGWVRK